jgi:hypothetical protein
MFMKKIPKIQKRTCLCGGECCKEQKISRPPYFIPGIKITVGPDEAPIYGCHDGIRYIQTTHIESGVSSDGSQQYSHGWVTLGKGCKPKDVPI